MLTVTGSNGPVKIDFGSLSLVASQPLAKIGDAVLNTALDQAMRWERRAFHSVFSTPDQQEVMQSLVEQRKP